MENKDKQINWKTAEFDGVNHRDYPDYCDAYVIYAEYTDGTELTAEELEALDPSDFYDILIEKLH
jgi:hypothetical protein